MHRTASCSFYHSLLTKKKNNQNHQNNQNNQNNNNNKKQTQPALARGESQPTCTVWGEVDCSQMVSHPEPSGCRIHIQKKTSSQSSLLRGKHWGFPKVSLILILSPHLFHRWRQSKTCLHRKQLRVNSLSFLCKWTIMISYHVTWHLCTSV